MDRHQVKVLAAYSVATGILTLVASQLSLQQKLPKKVYITYAGLYLICSYMFLFTLGIYSVVKEYLHLAAVAAGAEEEEEEEESQSDAVVVFDGEFLGTCVFSSVWV